MKYLTFDDVLIEPNYSDINSRSDISLDTKFLDYDLKLPILSANMDYVTEENMAFAMIKDGGFYVLHRFMPNKTLYDICDILVLSGTPVSISIGTRDPDCELQKALHISRFGGGALNLMTVTVDVAHGHHQKVIDMIKRLKDVGFPRVIAGNVATRKGYRALADAGADAIKVGIGPGSVCTTREVTGVGIPQLQAIMHCVEERLYYDGPQIIADGGIKNSGDIVKALAAGADVVMLGSLLAGTNECPGETRTAPDNSRWRPYRGQSIFGTNESKFVPEGIMGWVPEKGPVSDVLRKLAGGIRSGMSYVGARNLTELRQKAHFLEVSSGTILESGTRVASD